MIFLNLWEIRRKGVPFGRRGPELSPALLLAHRVWCAMTLTEEKWVLWVWEVRS